MDDSGDLATLRQRLKNKQLSTRQPRVYEVVDGLRELMSEATGLLADCLHAPLQWIREKEGTLLGVATRRDPFNAGGMLADLLPALQGVRWDPCTGLWSTVDIFSSVECASSIIQGCDGGFKLDQLNFGGRSSSSQYGLVVAQTACRAHGLNVLNAAAFYCTEGEGDCREWVVSDSCKSVNCPRSSPAAGQKSQASSRQGAGENAERQLTKPLRASDPPGHRQSAAHTTPGARCPPGARRRLGRAEGRCHAVAGAAAAF